MCELCDSGEFGIYADVLVDPEHQKLSAVGTSSTWRSSRVGKTGEKNS